MIIKKITSNEAFAGLEKSWQQLFEAAEINSPFLSWEWMFTWWQVYASRLKSARLCIFTAYDEDVLVAILPLFSHKKRNFTYLQLLGTEFESSDYLDVIAPNEKKKEICHTFFRDAQVLAELKNADILKFNNLKKDAILYQEKDWIAQRLKSEVHERRTSICPYLVLPDSLDDLFKTLSRNMRSSLKRQRNKLKREKNIRITLIQEIDKIEQAVRDLFKLHQMRFKQKNKFTKFIYDQRGKFHEKIAKIFLLKNWLQFYLILNNEKPIGALYCYKINGTMMYVQGGFDPQYAKLALGNQIILRAIGDAISAKMHTFDFMRGNEEYKKKWTDKRIFLYTLEFPLSMKAKGLLLFRNYLTRLKALVKNTLHLS